MNPEGGKIARAAAVSPFIEAGNIYLPHSLWQPWVNDFIEECAAFPNGAHDDQVDAMTQALLRWNMAIEETVVISLAQPVQISPI
ncbi:MAG: phage terminase large subunit [Acidobacteriota bacterium]|nr:phage terminase large subunit [Acidobacteriota bacterium]